MITPQTSYSTPWIQNTKKPTNKSSLQEKLGSLIKKMTNRIYTNHPQRIPVEQANQGSVCGIFSSTQDSNKRIETMWNGTRNKEEKSDKTVYKNQQKMRKERERNQVESPSLSRVSYWVAFKRANTASQFWICSLSGRVWIFTCRLSSLRGCTPKNSWTCIRCCTTFRKSFTIHTHYQYTVHIWYVECTAGSQRCKKTMLK